MNTINFKACKDNMGEVTADQYSTYKAAVKTALEAEYPNSSVSVGDSGFANASECQINGTDDVSRDDVLAIANRVFESDVWW